MIHVHFTTIKWEFKGKFWSMKLRKTNKKICIFGAKFTLPLVIAILEHQTQ